MLQRDHLFDWRTIEQNALLGLEVKKRLNAETHAYAAELLDRYGLGAFKDYYPRQLSGGMKQKAALIRTLAFSPELLLLDEPFSALDYQQRLLLADEVHSIIKRGGYTAVLVTHDISEAICMSDRVIILSERPRTNPQTGGNQHGQQTRRLNGGQTRFSENTMTLSGRNSALRESGSS